MFKINEIFYSLQGEGFHTGTPAVFVRFSGCNLHCAFCDTQHQTGTLMSPPFVEELKRQTGKHIAIETNGTRPLPTNLDWVTFSPKTGFDGGDAEPCALKQCDELKVVYLGQDLRQYEGIKASHRFLQPCFSEDDAQCQINMKACVEAVLNNPGWRISLQTHRILNIR